jgi:hypothetical protein
MTRRTRRLLILAVVGAAALAAGVSLVWPQAPRSEINQENIARIRPGTTLAEVEATLGGPARDESTGPLASDLSEGLESYDRPGRLKWQSDRAVIWLHLDAEGKAGKVSAVPVRRAEEGPLDRLRRWLGL